MPDNHDMQLKSLSLELVITTSAALTVFYMLSIILDLNLALIMGLFISAAVTTLWMVFRILKDPYSTDKTFDDYFYQDRNDLRRNGTE